MCVVGAAVVLAVGATGAQAAPGDLGSPQPISSAQNASQPAIAYNPRQNRYFVVWEGEEGASPDEEDEIFGRLLGPGGVPLGSPFVISSAGPVGEAEDPDLAYNSVRDEFMVVWGDDRHGALDSEIYAQRISSDGAQLGGDMRITQSGSDGDATRAMLPAVAYNAVSDQYLVAYDRNQPGGEAANREVYGQRLSSNGMEVGGDTKLTDFKSRTDAGSPPGSPQYDAAKEPDVASVPSGSGFLVTFTGYDYLSFETVSTGSYRIRGKDEIYTLPVSAGGGAGGPQEVSQMGEQGDYRTQAGSPAVEANATAGQYLILWRGDDVDSEFAAFAQTVTATGGEVGQDDKKISGQTSPGDPAAAHNPIANEYLGLWPRTFSSGGGLSTEGIGQRLSSALTEIGTDDQLVSAARSFGHQAEYGSIPNEYLIVYTSSGVVHARTLEPPPAPNPACSDGIDNDGDGKADHPVDPGCSTATDTDETDPPADPGDPSNPGNTGDGGDTTDPEGEVSKKGKAKAGKPVKLEVSSDEDGEVLAKGTQTQTGKAGKKKGKRRAASATVEIAKRKAKKGKKLKLKLKPARALLQAGQTKTLKLKPKGKKSAKKLKRTVKKGAKAKAKINVTFTDAAGNTSREKLSLKLK